MFSISPASGGGDRRQEPMGRIKSPVSIVAGKRLLVRPAIADIPQLAHKTPFGTSQRVSIDLVPRLPHDPKEGRGVHAGNMPLRILDRLS